MSNNGAINAAGERPEFSVIIGCYNHRKFIQETVNSVRGQSYQALQIIVVDDASPDDSISVIRALGPDITVVDSTENYGGSASRNRGAAVAQGDYLIFLDGDDALTPWALELYAKLIKHYYPPIILASMFFFAGETVANSELFANSDTPVLNYDGFSEDIVYMDYPKLARKEYKFRSSGSSMVFERAAFERCCGWTDDIFPGEDTDIMLKMLSAAPALHVLSPPTAYYRVHSSNTMKQIERFITGLSKVLKRAKLGYYLQFGSTRGRHLRVHGRRSAFLGKNSFQGEEASLGDEVIPRWITDDHCGDSTARNS